MTTPKRTASAGGSGRYSTVAIALHWLIAAVIVLQLFLGWRLSDVSGLARSSLLSLHKSIGVTILLLSLLRLGWRLANRPPAEPATLTSLEVALSSWVHRGFYGIMIGLPVTGWAMISTTRAGANTLLFGVVPWPRLPFLNALPPGPREGLSNLADNAHVALVWVTLALLALHLLGALKHHFISRDGVIARMAPGVRAGALFEPRLVAIALVGVGAAGAAYALKTPPPPPPRPKVVTLANADAYLDVVAPALERRCVSCHNDDRSKGGLSLATYEALMAGGKDGVVVVPRSPAKSNLYKRITLPSTHDRYMPADGKTPLTEAQVAAIGWWIAVGAPPGGRVGRLAVSDVSRPLLEQALGLASEAQGGGAGAPERLPSVARGDPDAIKGLEQAGYIVRPVAAGSNLLNVNLYARKQVDAADIANLAKLQDQIRSLSLRAAGVTDAHLKTIGQMKNLTQLRLEENGVTDAGVAALSGLQSLRVINLYGTKVTDEGMGSIQNLPMLQRIHAWQTGVTKPGAERIEAAHANLRVELGSEPVGLTGSTAPPPGAPAQR